MHFKVGYDKIEIVRGNTTNWQITDYAQRLDVVTIICETIYQLIKKGRKMLTIPVTVTEDGENCKVEVNVFKTTKKTTEQEKKTGTVVRSAIINSLKEMKGIK